MKNQGELYVVEGPTGEWVGNGSEYDYSVFTSQAEAQDALESAADSWEEAATTYKIVRFVRDTAL